MALRTIQVFGLVVLFTASASAQCSKYQLYANDSVGCLNEIISFKTIPAAPSGSVLNWDFEIKSVNNEASPTIAFTKADTYTVKLELKLPSSKTCNLERKNYLLISANPSLGAISSTKTELCELNKKATLTVKSTASSFTWSIDGTVYANRGNAVQHTFTKAGYKQAQVIANNKVGCETKRIYDSVLIVENKPLVTFPSSELVLCGKGSATLDPSFTFYGNSNYAYDWKLSGASKVSHTNKIPDQVTYSTPGTYYVELSISSNVTSCAYDYTFDDYVKVVNAPDIQIRSTPINGAGCKSKIYGLKLLPGNIDTSRITWFHNHGDTVTITKIKADSVVVSAEFTGTYVIWGKYKLASCDKLVSVTISLESNDLLADFDDGIPCICKIPSQLTVTNKSVHYNAKSMTYEWEVRNVKKGKLLKKSTDKDLSWNVDRFGNFIIKLRATDSDGCFEEKTHIIESRPFEGELRVAPVIACPGSRIRFEPRDTMCYESFDSVYWTLYELDGTVRRSKNDLVISEVYKDTGYYDVKAILTTNTGCRSVIRHDSMIHITNLKAIDLDYNKTKFCLGENISVSVNTKPLDIDGEWFGFLIGDNYVDTAIYSDNVLRFNPDIPGEYDLKVVFISESCKDSIYYTDHFRVGGVVFDFSPKDSSGCLPFKTSLSSSIIDNYLIKSTDTKLEYLWELTPPSLGKLLSPSSSSTELEIENLGTASISLTIMNADSCATKLVKTDLFKFDLSADFSVPDKSCKGVGITLDNNSKGTISKIEWTVNEPTATFSPSASAFQPLMYINQPGSYTVNLMIEDNNGCKEFLSRDLSVIDFDFDFTVDDTMPQCSPASFTFTATGTNVDTFYWDFGDGSPLETTANSNILKIYDLTRVIPYRNRFDVKFYAWNNIGCLDSIVTEDLLIVRGPVPYFDIVNGTGCSPLEVSFINKSISTTKIFFDFGDDASVDSVNYSSHVYEVDTSNEFVVFKPFIVAQDDHNCKLSYTPEDSILVYSRPMALFSHTEEVGCSPHTVSFADSSIYAYNWIWHYGTGDSLTDSSHTTSYTYETGTYRPYLVVTNKIGCPDTLKIPNKVEALKPPRALFNVSDTITCIGVEVDFLDSTRSKYPVYEWKWNFGDPNTLGDTSIAKNAKYSYTESGVYDINLIVIDSNGCTDTLVREKGIRIYKELPIELPEIDLVTVESDQLVELSFDMTPKFAFNRYLIHEANQLINDITILKRKDTALVLPGLLVDSNQYCFNVEMIDKCEFSHPGDTHCTVLLTVDRSQEEVTVLNWTSYVGWDSVLNYTIYRGKPGLLLNPIAELPETATGYIDSGVCNQEYQYAVKAIRRGDSAKSTSNYVEFQPEYVFQINPLRAHLATVNNGAVEFYWQKSIQRNVKNYIIDRKAFDNVWIKGWKRTGDTVFIDTLAKTQEKNYYYQVRVVDDCDYQSTESNLASSILLQAVPTDRNFQLSWNHYRDWPKGVASYIVQRRSVEGAPFRTLGVLPGVDTSFLDTSAFLLFEKSFSYRVLAVENHRLADTSKSNIRTVEPLPTLFVPNAFTPNNNGVNDVFLFKAVALLPDSVQDNNFKMSIFNRWGQQVFEANSQHDGWDGTFNGQACQQDVYVYIISAQGLDGSLLYRKGTITLLR